MMEYNHGLYFDLTTEHELIPTDELHPRKPPDSQLDSVATARTRMAAAAQGLLPKRGPITVRAGETSGYEVIDGNATFAVAVESEWPDLPCRVDGSLYP